MTAAIEYIQATKTYDKQKQPSLHPLNLRIDRGDFFGLLGHNGAGKTTAINMLCGVVDPSGGEVRVLDLDVTKHPKESKRYLGVVPQEIYADSFFNLELMLRIQSKLSGVKPDAEWIAFLLDRLALKNHAKKTTRELSGGMKRRMMIARALVHKPKIIVLDEPTAGVDVELRHSMWEFIRELHSLGNTIVLTTHYLEEAEQFCNRIAILKAGRLVTLKKSHELLELGNKPKILFFLHKSAIGSKNELEALVKTNDALDVECGEMGPEKQCYVACHFDASQPESLVAATSRLEKIVAAHALKVTHVSTEEPTLEQVFLKLTRGDKDET